MRASIQFALNQILQAHVLQMSGNTASEVALRKFEKRVDTSGIGQSAVDWPDPPIISAEPLENLHMDC
jgi:hypothetical protein